MRQRGAAGADGRQSSKAPLFLAAALAGLPSALTAQQCPRAATYVAAFAFDTISIDRQSYLADTTTGSMLGKGGPQDWSLIRYRAVMAPDGLVRTLSLSIWPLATDSMLPPRQTSEVTFGPRTVTAVVSDSRRGSQTQVDSVVPGTMPYMDNAPFFMAALVRRGAALKADSVDIPMLWLFTRGTSEVMTILRRGSDSLLLRTPRMQLNAKRSGGRLVGSWRNDSVAITRSACR